MSLAKATRLHLQNFAYQIATVTPTEVKESSLPGSSKSKIKTRPQEERAPENDSAASDLAILKLTDENEKIAVGKESLGLFTRMFTRSTYKQGMTKWTEFVAALKDAGFYAGFSATHNGGSVVTFTDERAGKGAIVFHRPHPDPKIDSNMLRGWGKRLRKWFGLDDNMFILRGK